MISHINVTPSIENIDLLPNVILLDLNFRGVKNGNGDQPANSPCLTVCMYQGPDSLSPTVEAGYDRPIINCTD
jgi:hypothetical protein